jgi:hypothetical protein
MFRLIVLFAFIAVATAGKSISCSTDAMVNGIEGLNVKWEVPFKVDEYVVGFKYSLSELKRAPQTLFAKRKFEVNDDMSANIDAEFNVADKTLEVAMDWVSDKAGIALSALADSKEMLKKVGASTSNSFSGFNIDLSGKYNLLSKVTDVTGKLKKDDTTASVKYNTDDKDILLSVNHDLDSRNSLEPQISLTTGDITYGWTRKWNGGSLNSKYHPGDKAEFKWIDNGVSGTWTTKAEVPLENTKNTKVSFSRDWNY